MRPIKLILYLSVFTLLVCCTVNYSFNGGKVPNGAKTIQIDYFPVSSKAPLASGLSSQTFTEALRDVFLAQTKLDMVSEKGDLVFQGEIVAYSISPINISSTSETADQNRLTMGVQVNDYLGGDSLMFGRLFKRFADYESNKEFSTIEEDLLAEINDQLTQDIFNASLGDW